MYLFIDCFVLIYIFNGAGSRKTHLDILGASITRGRSLACLRSCHIIMGGAVSAGQNNEELVDNLCNEGYIHEPRVEKVPHPPSPSYQYYVHVYTKYLGCEVADFSQIHNTICSDCWLI